MSDPILEDAIDSFCASGQCAICEDHIDESEAHRVVVAHNTKFLCHTHCVAKLYVNEEEDEDGC